LPSCPHTQFQNTVAASDDRRLCTSLWQLTRGCRLSLLTPPQQPPHPDLVQVKHPARSTSRTTPHNR
jgi:hypothetical protein